MSYTWSQLERLFSTGLWVMYTMGMSFGVERTSESIHTRLSRGTCAMPMRMFGPESVPIKRMPPASKVKTEPPQRRLKVLPPLSLHLVSWLPGTM